MLGSCDGFGCVMREMAESRGLEGPESGENRWSWTTSCVIIVMMGLVDVKYQFADRQVKRPLSCLLSQPASVPCSTSSLFRVDHQE